MYKTGCTEIQIQTHVEIDATATFTFSHLADAFIQRDLQMMTMEAIKINKRATICKCYNKSVSLTQYT